MASAGFLYLGEAAGPRILRYGVGFSQVGDGYQLEVKYWDGFPFGETGEGVVRSIITYVRHTNGYQVAVVPVLDGVEDTARSFSGGAPGGGLTEAIAKCVVPLFRRCTRLGAIVRTTALLGETEIIDTTFVPVFVRAVQ